ncbi:MAG: hypothetical protein HOP13_06650, partial [Alphaproteobacteria bacterium]|nr:hypothetical protein [Alphaproteobacteria bacterium]
PFTSIKVGGPASIRLAQRLGLKGKGAIAARLRFARQHELEAGTAGRGTPTLQEKPAEREAALMPLLEAADLEDVLEDEEAMAPPVKREGFGVGGDPCPKMGSLVQRRADA